MVRRSQRVLSARKYDALIATLVDELGIDETAAIWVRAERRLDGMLAWSASLPTGELIHAVGFILPMSAIYLELTNAVGRERAFALMDEFFKGYSEGAAPIMRRICALPGGRAFFIRGFGVAVGFMFGTANGFENVVRERSGKRLAYDVYSCPYQRITAQLGAPELCPLFCRNDEICYGHIDGIRFERTGTLARGAGKCDFALSLEE